VLSNRFLYISVFLLAILLVTFNLSAKKKLDLDELDSFSNYLNEQEMWPGRVAPDFELALMDGREFKLSDNIGKKIIILNFFATWCEPCRQEMPELSKFYLERQDDKFIMIGIDVDEKIDVVRSFLAKADVSFPVGIDIGGKIAAAYSANGLPTTVVIGADGLIKLYEVGAIANAEISFNPYLEAGVAAIIAGEVINPAEYQTLLKNQPEIESPDKEPEEKQLTGRARAISLKMDCPCGCSHLLAECTCNTGDKIKTKLSGMDFAGKSDREIIMALNEEFCVRDD